jgi:hypothetical protein
VRCVVECCVIKIGWLAGCVFVCMKGRVAKVRCRG